jgi:hypothetical protein
MAHAVSGKARKKGSEVGQTIESDYFKFFRCLRNGLSRADATSVHLASYAAATRQGNRSIEVLDQELGLASAWRNQRLRFSKE